MLLALRLGEPISKQALIFRVCLRDLTGQTLHDATTLFEGCPSSRRRQPIRSCRHD
jgi:hypothetical protein